MRAAVDPVALQAWLARQLPQGALGRVADLDAEWDVPFSQERALVAHAVPKRRREFLAGRALAHELLVRLSAPAEPLLPGARRQPLWPAGFVGSISHSRQALGVVLARRRDVDLLGIDLEPDQVLPQRLLSRILRPAEEQRLVSWPMPPGHAARLVFSAKECAYKALVDRLDRVLGFHELEVVCVPGGPPDQGRFVAHFVRTARRQQGCPAEVTGVWRRASGVLLSLVAQPRPSARPLQPKLNLVDDR